jgi:hypothetical protein
MYLRKRFFQYVILAAVAVVSVQCSDDDSTPEDPKSTGKTITSFKFSGLSPAVTATIAEAAKTIAATVPAGTNVTALVPTLEISEDASVSPTSGTAQNFTTPVTYTVTAEDGSKQTYTVTVTVEEEQEVACYATELPGGEVNMFITYNTDNKTAVVNYREFNQESNSGYRSEFEYANGKVSRINNYLNTEIRSYTLFTYSAETIVESYYARGSGELALEHYYIYHLTGDRVTSWGRHSIQEGGAQLDSAVLTYTNDNVTRITRYRSGDDGEWSYIYDYDDKVNPFKQVGLSGDDDEYFHPLVLSKNNIVKVTAEEDEDDVQEISYTYNDQGLPLTRTFEGSDGAQTFAYDCR